MGGILMAKVSFKRIEDSGNIDNVEVEDGSFIVTGDGKTYIDYGDSRIAIGGTPDSEMSDISRNTVENKVIKEYVDNLSESKTDKYNLITGGNAIKTGRKIDDKDEYVKRILCDNLGGNGEAKSYSTGINVANSIITDIKVMGVSGSNNWFPFPNNDAASSKISLTSGGNLSITFYNSYWQGTTAYANIYYISR
jgi:hypothetical protein